MEKKKETSAPDNKLSYDELERVAIQLNARVKELSEALIAEQDRNTWGRLEIMLRCISSADAFKDEGFIANCCEEIKLQLFPKKEE